MDFAGMKRRELQALCKRHGLPAGGTNVDLVARLEAALSGPSGAEEEAEVVVAAEARKGCLKRSVGDAGEAKKVTFAVEETRGRRLRSRVVWSPVVAKTRGKRAEAGADSAADGRISSEAGANPPVRRSRRNSLTAAEAQKVEEVVTVDRRRKRKSQEIGEDVAVSALVVVSTRATRRSSLSGTTVLLPPTVDKKRGRGKAADGKNKLVAEEQVPEAQHSSAVPPTVVETKRSKRKGENCEPDVQKATKVEALSRTTRSRSVEAVVMSPTVVENKRRRKTGDAQPDVELPAVSQVPRNDAPVTRSLRNRAAQVNNSVMEETYTGKQQENKMQPTRPATRRHQQVASCVEEEDQEQVAAPSKGCPLRRSGRNNSEASNANSETDELSSAPVEANDSNVVQPLTHTKAEDVEKQPIVKEPVRRSTRKSVVSAMLDNEKDIIEENNPEARRRSIRKSIVPVTDIKGAAEDIQTGKGEDAAKQPAVKEPVRRSVRKSIVSAMHEKEGKDLVAEKNPGAHAKRSMRKSVVPVNGIKGAGEENQNAKSEDVETQLAVKQPVRRSSRKSLLPDALENESGFLVTETNAEAHVRGSTRKSVLPDVFNKENQSHSKEARNDNFQIGKCIDEKQQKVKEPVRRSRRSVATVILEEQNKGLNEGKMTTIPTRRSIRKSVALNVVEKGSMDHTIKVAREQSGVGTRKLKVRDHAVAVATCGNESQVEVAVQNNQGLQQSTGKSSNNNLSDDNKTHTGSDKYVSCEEVGEEGLTLRKHRRSSMEVSSSTNDSWIADDFSGQRFRKQQSTQTPSVKDNTGDNCGKPLITQQASDSTISKGRSSKRRRTTAPEEVISAEKANDDMVVRGATKDVHKVFPEYSKESSSRIQEICQVNTTREEFSSGSLLVTVRLSDEICTAQSEVIPGSESSDAAKESSDKSKQAQEHTDIQADDSHLSVTRNGELDQPSSIAELLPHNSIVSEDKTLMGEADVMSTGLHTKSLQHGIDILAKETGEGVVPMSCAIEEHRIKYPMSTAAVEMRTSGEASACESAGKTLSGVLSNDLHTKHMHNDCDVLTKKIGEASGSALPISGSNQAIHCDAAAEGSIQAADLGRCPSKGGKGNPLSINLHSEGAADDSILPVLNAAKACSSDGRHSSFGLEFLFTEECKESCSRNVEDTSVEVDGGNKSSTYVAPGFCVGSDCGPEDEDVQPTGFDADKKLDVNQDVTEEEVVAEEKSIDEHAAAKTDLKAKLNGELAGLHKESDCSIAGKNARLVACNPDDDEAIIQAQQDYVQEGDKSSQSPATPECNHECGLPVETVLHSNKNKECLSSAEQSPLGLQSLFSQESLEKSVYDGALASATVHTENGTDELKDCHVKLALEKPHVSEPFPHHDTNEGLSSDSLDEECVSSSFSLDAKHVNEAINSEEVACKGEGSKELAHPDDLKASSEKTDVNGPVDDAYGVSDIVLSSALHGPANDNYDACLGSNTEQLHQSHIGRCSEDTEEQFASKSWTNDIPEVATAKSIESGVILLPAEEISHLQDGQLNSESDGAKIVESGLNCSKDISSILDDGSAVRIAGLRTLSGSSLPKDPSTEYNLQQELLNGSSEETFLDGPDTIENCSFTFSLATPGYENGGASSEEAVCTMKKYAGTCSSNPRELLMDLQSLFSKENIEESDPDDDLAFPSAGSPGDESIDVGQRVKVHLGSNLSQLESTDLLDELIECSKTEVRHHGHKDRCSEDMAEQVASGPCTNEIVETATAKYIESGVVLLPSDERSNWEDGQLKPKQENLIVMESCLDNCNKDATNTSDNGSILDIVVKRSTSGSGLPEDYRTDHSLRQECLDGLSGESSLQGSTICGKKIVSGVAATTDYKQEGALSDEAVRKMKDYTGTCSVDPRHLIMELQSLFSEGSIEKSDSHDDLACPSAEKGRNEPIVCHVEKLSDTLISSEHDTYKNLHQDLSRAGEKDSCMPISVQHNDSEGLLRSSHMKDWVMSVHTDLSHNAHLTERNVIAKEVLCEEKEKRKSMPASDGDMLHEKSQSIENGVLRQHHKEDYYEHNVDQVASGICAMSEAAPIKALENGIALVHAVETSALPDEKINPELESDEVEKHSLNCVEDTSQILGTRSMMSKTALLPKDSHTIYCQEQELPNDLSLLKSAKEFAICLDESFLGSGICQPHSQKHTVEYNSTLSSYDTEVLHQDHKEENNGPNEEKIIPKALENNMFEAARVEGMKSAIMLPSVAGMLEMPDEQLKTKLCDRDEEHSFSCDKDTIENFCSGSAKKDLFALPKCPFFTEIDCCQKQEAPDALSSPKYPEESANCLDESVSGSGLYQTSWKQCINESSMQLTSNIEAFNQDHEESNENNEGQIAPVIPSSGVSAAADIERSEGKIGLTPAAGTSALPDEQDDTEVEGHEVDEHSCSYDKDTSSLFDTKSLNSKASILHKDTHMDHSSEDNPPNDLSAPRSPEESTVCPDYSVLGSVGICQSSRRRGIDELRAKLQSFKVSSTVKGSYIAMSAPRPKQGDNLSQSAIALLRNRENTPAVKADHPAKPNPDRSVAKDSSRRALQPICRRPGDH